MSAQIVNTIRAIRPDDIIIMFIGPSGSGRSNFIDLLTGQPGQRTGDSLCSKTLNIEMTRVRHPLYGNRIVLVDTPGLICTSLSEEEVLQMIASWTRKIYGNGARLSGIIYTSRVTDLRVPTAALSKCLRIFRKLCDDFTMVQLFLITTMWEEINADSAVEAERTLVERYWKPTVQRGSKMDQLRRSVPDEAWRIIEQLIRGKAAPATTSGSPWLAKFWKAFGGRKKPKALRRVASSPI